MEKIDVVLATHVDVFDEELDELLCEANEIIERREGLGSQFQAFFNKKKLIMEWVQKRPFDHSRPPIDVKISTNRMGIIRKSIDCIKISKKNKNDTNTWNWDP